MADEFRWHWDFLESHCTLTEVVFWRWKAKDLPLHGHWVGCELWATWEQALSCGRMMLSLSLHGYWFLIPVHRFWKCRTVRVCIDLFNYMILSQKQGSLIFSLVLFGQIHQLVHHPLRCTFTLSILATHLLNCTVLHKCLLMCLLSQACWCIIFTASAALWTGCSFTCLIIDCKSMTVTTN